MIKKKYPLEEEFFEKTRDCIYDNIYDILYLSLKAIEAKEKFGQENKKLKERVEYLERSNDRREDEILSLREKLNDSEDKISKAMNHLAKLQVKEIENDYVIDGEDLEYVREILNGEDEDE